MFNFNQGNPNLKLSAGSAPSNVAAFKMPGQDQIGAGSGVKEMMLMNMLQGMMNKGGNESQTYGQDYQAQVAPLMQGQRDPQQLAYQQAIKTALMGGRA